MKTFDRRSGPAALVYRVWIALEQALGRFTFRRRVWMMDYRRRLLHDLRRLPHNPGRRS